MSVSNSLDPDQARQCVGPDLGTNCLQELTADDKNVTVRLRVNRFVPDKAFNSCGIYYLGRCIIHLHVTRNAGQNFQMIWVTEYCFHHIIIIIRFLINVQMQEHHPHQWAPFQVTG